MAFSKAFSISSRNVSGISVWLIMLSVLASYLIIAPVWSPRLLWWRYDNARLLEIALLLSIGVLTAMPAASRAVAVRWSELGGVPKALLAVFCAAGALSAVLSSVPQVGILQISLVVLLVCMTLNISTMVKDNTQTQNALSFAICAGALLVVLQFWAAQAVYMAQADSFPWVSPFLTFANVRFFSQYQSYALLLIVLPIALFKLGRPSKVMLYVLAANFWSLQWMVGTRAVWAGFLVAVAAVAVFGGTQRGRWIRLQSIGLAGGLVIFLVFTRLMMPSADAPEIPKTHSVVERGWESVNERVIMMKGALGMIRENPFLGVGPGQFGHNYSATLAAHPHNSALQHVSEYGLVGGGAAVLLLAMLGIAALGSIRSASSGESSAVGVYVAAALIMGLVESCFSGNLTMPHSQIMFCVVAGWLLGLRPGQATAVQAHRLPAMAQHTRLALVSVILLAVSLVFVLTYEYVHAIHGMPYWLNPNPPNLWQYGRFSAW
ncbi:MAG: O-antigen ligase family protein [Betaproteobacteria bacterium]|nr:MAG: O-antigen ligase family protein [Betaproteobacteria bacterium]